MRIRVENSFAVPAPIEETWNLLVDVQRVVPCMPGTELAEALDERRFRARGTDTKGRDADSGFALLLATLKAMLRRWFGARF